MWATTQIFTERGMQPGCAPLCGGAINLTQGGRPPTHPPIRLPPESEPPPWTLAALRIPTRESCAPTKRGETRRLPFRRVRRFRHPPRRAIPTFRGNDFRKARIYTRGRMADKRYVYIYRACFVRSQPEKIVDFVVFVYSIARALCGQNKFLSSDNIIYARNV